MIAAAHVIIYTKDAVADRAFFRDVLRLPAIDSGDGWLIFALPPAELACHPATANDTHQLYLMCTSLTDTIAELKARGVECDPPAVERWGMRTAFRLPGGGTLGLYQPRHRTAITMR